MKTAAAHLWVYLNESPLLWLTLTLVAYLIASRLHVLCRRNPIVNPVVISIVILVSLLLLTRTDYETYFEGAEFVHFLLGPAVVALAIPLRDNFTLVRKSVVPLVVSLFAGSLTAIGSVVAIAWVLGAEPETIKSLLPKSVTAPIAMGISHEIGGLPSLTAVLVVLTGVIGAMFATHVYRLIRVSDPAACGFGLGMASHGIGTARAFQESAVAGTFAGIAIGLNGLLTAVLLPLLVKLAGAD